MWVILLTPIVALMIYFAFKSHKEWEDEINFRRAYDILMYNKDE